MEQNEVTNRIKAAVQGIAEIMGKPSSEINVPRKIARLLNLQADLDDAESVPLEIFEIMPNDMRKACLEGLVILLLKTLQNDAA